MVLALFYFRRGEPSVRPRAQPTALDNTKAPRRSRNASAAPTAGGALPIMTDAVHEVTRPDVDGRSCRGRTMLAHLTR